MPVAEHVEFGGHTEAQCVLTRRTPGVHVGIDETGCQGLAAAVDHLITGGYVEVLAHRLDETAFHHHVDIFQRLTAVEHPHMTYGEAVGRGGFAHRGEQQEKHRAARVGCHSEEPSSTKIHG